MSWILVVHERFFFRKKPLAPPAFPENGTQREISKLFESTNNSRLFDAADGGRTRTLSPERDFKSLVSASLRQIPFSFVVSFDFSLRERFFLRERGGFALFYKMIISHFSPHVNHVKLFHLVVLDLRSVRDPGRSPCPDALLRVGVMMRGG